MADCNCWYITLMRILLGSSFCGLHWILWWIYRVTQHGTPVMILILVSDRWEYGLIRMILPFPAGTMIESDRECVGFRVEVTFTSLGCTTTGPHAPDPTSPLRMYWFESRTQLVCLRLPQGLIICMKAFNLGFQI